MISENNRQIQISIEFDENDRIISFSMTPKIFNVKTFLTPKFLYEFKQYYRLLNLASDLEDSDTVKEINEDENYSVSLQEKKLTVEQLYEEAPFFG